jgi:hypothetical protein
MICGEFWIANGSRLRIWPPVNHFQTNMPQMHSCLAASSQAIWNSRARSSGSRSSTPYFHGSAAAWVDSL